MRWRASFTRDTRQTHEVAAQRARFADRRAMTGVEYGVITATLAVLPVTIVVSHLVAQARQLAFGRIRTPGRTCLNGRVAGSATTGPGAMATRIRSAIGVKSARKCTEDFSARIGALAGSMPTWRMIA